MVTWDTLDSLTGCYAEYGNCPEESCTSETRKISGIDLSIETKYDRQRGTDFVSAKASTWTDSEVNAERIFQKIISTQESKVAELKQKWAMRPGVEVTVSRGRDLPVGSTGIVFWVGRNSWGTVKIGARKQSGEVFWTSANSVFVSDPEPKSENEARLTIQKVATSRSGKAFFVRVEDGRNLWVPTSAIKFVSDNEAIIQKWWLEQNAITI